MLGNVAWRLGLNLIVVNAVEKHGSVTGDGNPPAGAALCPVFFMDDGGGGVF